MRARLVVLIGALALAGCSTRERDNPFDPANGTTAGRPVNFEALASDRTVQLRWQGVTGEGLIGFQIYRHVAGDTSAPITGTLPITTTQYIDRGLLNGVDHFYSIYYVFDRGRGNDPATDVATPGTRIPWMIDIGAPAQPGLLARLTADGRRVAEIRALLSPTELAVDSVSHHVWVSDLGDGSLNSAQIAILDSDTGIFTTTRNPIAPGDIATQSSDSTAWVCDETGDRVIHLDSHGGTRFPTLDNLNRPTGVAVDPSDGTIWVCEHDNDRVKHYAASGVLLDSAFVIRPLRVAIDELTHKAWVTSATQAQVHRIAPGGIVEGSFTGFAGPTGIEVDSRRGRIWIADPNADRVTVLARDGSVAFQVPGMPAARRISIDRETGEAWVALPASHEVVWLSATGSVLRRLGGFQVPVGVAILP